MQEQQAVSGEQAVSGVGPMMEAAGVPWWGVYLAAIIASALVAYLCVLILKGLAKSWMNRDHKVDDPWWWQWGWRAVAVAAGAGVGLVVVPPPWGYLLGIVGGGFASYIVRLVKGVVKSRTDQLVAPKP